jgi:hypothetical protein
MTDIQLQTDLDKIYEKVCSQVPETIRKSPTYNERYFLAKGYLAGLDRGQEITMGILKKSNIIFLALNICISLLTITIYRSLV